MALENLLWQSKGALFVVGGADRIILSIKVQHEQLKTNFTLHSNDTLQYWSIMRELNCITKAAECPPGVPHAKNVPQLSHLAGYLFQAGPPELGVGSWAGAMAHNASKSMFTMHR
jgi:hypothetical protein